MSLGVAFRAFFSALSDSKRSEAIRRVLEAEIADLDKADFGKTEAAQPRLAEPEKGSTDVKKVTKAVQAKPSRSEALTLLAALQREARLVDLVQEPLDQYGDAQVGAAARPCLKQCKQAIERVFGLQPLVEEPENSVIDVPEKASAVRCQWVGDAGAVGRKGRLVHPGWTATRCELPQWTGAEEDAMVIAAAEVEKAN